MKRVLLVLGCLLALATGTTYAGDLTLTWVAPTTCADGSALVNCPTTAYEVSQSDTLQGAYTVKESVAANVLTTTYRGLTPGQYCFLVKTVASTLKSAESTHACATVPLIGPKAPQGLTVTVNVTVSTQ